MASLDALLDEVFTVQPKTPRSPEREPGSLDALLDEVFQGAGAMSPPPEPGWFSRAASSVGGALAHVFGQPPDVAEEAFPDLAAEAVAPVRDPALRRGYGATGTWEAPVEPAGAAEAGVSPSELVAPAPPLRLPGPPVQPGAAAAVAPPPAIAPVTSQLEMRRQAPGAAVEGIAAPRIPLPIDVIKGRLPRVPTPAETGAAEAALMAGPLARWEAQRGRPPAVLAPTPEETAAAERALVSPPPEPRALEDVVDLGAVAPVPPDLLPAGARRREAVSPAPGEALGKEPPTSTVGMMAPADVPQALVFENYILTPGAPVQSAAQRQAERRKARLRGEIPSTFAESAGDVVIDAFKTSAVGAGIASGLYSTAAGMMSVVPWVEQLAGVKTGLGDVFKDAAARIGDVAERLTPDDPGWLHTISAGFGSSMGFFVPGIGLGKALQLIRVASPRLALWVGSGTAAIMEAGTEAGAMYQDALNLGLSEQQATSRANHVFWQNLIVLAATNKAGIFSESGGLLRRTAKGIGAEAFQEATQEVIGERQKMSVTENPYAVRDVFSPERLKQYGTAAVVGGTVGGVLGGGRAWLGRRTITEAKKAAGEDQFAILVAEAERQGLKGDAAELAVAQMVLDVREESVATPVEAPAVLPPVLRGQTPEEIRESGRQAALKALERERPQFVPAPETAAPAAPPASPAPPVAEAPTKAPEPPEAAPKPAPAPPVAPAPEVAAEGEEEAPTEWVANYLAPDAVDVVRGAITAPDGSLLPTAADHVNTWIGYAEQAKAAAPDLADQINARVAELQALLNEVLHDQRRRLLEPPKPAKPTGTGEPFSTTLYQGRGKSREQIFGRLDGVSILGPAQYYALNERDAARYGAVTTHQVDLANPLVILSDREWFDLLRAADARQLSSVDKVPGSAEEAAQRLQDYIRGQGHDGLIARFPPANEADIGETDQNIKRLRESFGHSTVVKFPGPAAPAKPVAPPKVEPPVPAPPVAKPPAPPAPAAPVTPAVFTLPRDLAGAKPRFGYGDDNYTLDFESDLDKALFTVAQTFKNKRDADYMAALRTVYPDSEEQTIRDLGRAVKDRVKLLVKGQDVTQPVRVPTIMRVPAAKPAPAPPPAEPPAPPGPTLQPGQRQGALVPVSTEETRDLVAKVDRFIGGEIPATLREDIEAFARDGERIDGATIDDNAPLRAEAERLRRLIDEHLDSQTDEALRGQLEDLRGQLDGVVSALTLDAEQPPQPTPKEPAPPTEAKTTTDKLPLPAPTSNEAMFREGVAAARRITGRTEADEIPPDWEMLTGLAAVVHGRVPTLDEWQTFRNRWETALLGAHPDQGLPKAIAGLAATIRRQLESQPILPEAPRYGGTEPDTRRGFLLRADDLERALQAVQNERHGGGEVWKALSAATSWENRAADLEALGETDIAAKARERADVYQRAAETEVARRRKEIADYRAAAEPLSLEQAAARLAQPPAGDTFARTLVERLTPNQVQAVVQSYPYGRFGAMATRVLEGVDAEIVNAAREVLRSEDGLVIAYAPKPKAVLHASDLTREPRWGQVEPGDPRDAHGYSVTTTSGEFWGTAHLVEIGTPPKGIEVIAKPEMAKAVAEMLTKSAADAEPLTPIARNFTTRKGIGEVVYLSSPAGTAIGVDARYWDHFTVRHPNAKAMRVPGGDAPILFREGRTSAGLVMPLRGAEDLIPSAVKALASGQAKPRGVAEPTTPYSAVPGRPELVGPAETFKHGEREPVDEAFYYHVTTAAAARRIIREGFVPGRRQTMAEGVYRDLARGKVFLTDRQGVGYWRDRIEEHLEHQYDNPPKLVVVRVSRDAVSVESDPNRAWNEPASWVIAGEARRVEEPTTPYSALPPDEALIRRAERHYGVTEDWHEAGYVLPDGTMLDFSGRHYSSGYERKPGAIRSTPVRGQQDYLGGRRNVDHREDLSVVMPEFAPGDAAAPEGRRMRTFMDRTGAVRFHPSVPGLDFGAVPPTDAQLRVAIRAARETREPLVIDGPDRQSWTFDRPTLDAVREALGETRRVEESTVPYSALPRHRFYSTLLRAVEAKVSARASAGQILATVRAVPGVKAEEIKDTGLEEWLRAQGDRPITRAEVLEYLRANEVRVEIKKLGSVDDLRAEIRRRLIEEDSLGFDSVGEAFRAITNRREPLDGWDLSPELRSAIERYRATPQAERQTTRFGPDKSPTLSLPGGTGYVELLGKVPEREDLGETLAGEAAGGTPRAEAYVEPHFKEPAVFHVRAAEHDNEKGQRGLLIEEVQAERFLEARRLREKMAKDAGTITDENADRLALLESAPFAKSWHERAFKEALDYALRLPPDAQGRRIEWIGWTPGQVQVDRYDLSKHVDAVWSRPIETGWDLTLWRNNSAIESRTVADGDLEANIGKEVAERIRNRDGSLPRNSGPASSVRVLSGLDLKIGGAWAYNLYDEKLPNFVRGYVKKWGARVGQGHIDARDPAVMARADTLLGSIETEQPPQPIHQVTITDAMRRAVIEEGQAAFEPTTRYARRSDATEADDRGAQQAFDFLDQVASRPVSSLRGDVLGRRPTGVPRTLGVAFDVDQINKELRETGAVDFRGRLIASPEAYALAAQILRNPLIETARFHFTNDAGRVVYQESYTSRLPNSATVFATRDKVAEIQAMWERAQAAGATKAWMTHNHPTGDPKASDADLDLTAFVGEHMPLQGHVITNGTTYAFVAPDGTASVRDVPGVTEDLLLRPAVPHRLLRRKIENAENLAALGRELSTPEGWAVAFHVGADQRVRGIQELPIADLVDLDKAVPYLKESRAGFGAVETLLWTTTKDPKLAWNGQFLIRQGAIADYGWTGGTAVVELLGQPGTAAMLEEAAKLRERPGPAIRVEEGLPPEPTRDQPRDEAGRFVAEQHVPYVPDAEARRRGGRLLEAVRALPDTAQASQILRALRAAGVSDQALQASGLQGFLKFREGQRVSRDALGHFLQAPESVVPDLAEVGRVLTAADYETWSTKMATLVGEWARPHLPATWAHMRGETTPAGPPARGVIDAEAGTLREVEGLVTDAPAGAAVQIGDETFTRRADAIFPWTPGEEGGQPLSTPTLLGRIRDRRASLGYAPGPAAPPVAAPGTAPPATGPGSPASFKLMSRIAEIMDIPVRVGRMRQHRSVLGIFKAPPPVRGGKVPDVIRLRTAEDIETLTHEVGHYVSRLLWGSQWPGRRPSPRQLARRAFYRTHEAELMALAATHRKPSTEEGFAEFWRLYLTREAQARTSAPVLYGVLETEVGHHDPALLAALRNIRDWYVAWRSMEPSERVRAHIMSSREVDREREDARLDMFSIVEQAMDRYARVVTATEAMTKGAALPAERDPRVLIRALSGAPRLVDLFLFKGRTNLPEVFVKVFGASKGGGGALDFATRRRAGPSLEEALEPVRSRVDDWKVYMIARRVQELFRRRDDRAVRQRESLMRAWEMQESDVDGIVAKYDGPEFRQAHDTYQEWNRAVLAYVRDSGLLAGEVTVRDPAGGPSRTMSLYDLITDLNQSHFPFHRFFEERAEIGVPAGGKLTNVQQPVRAMTGSGRLFLDPLDTAVRNLYVMVMSAERHAVVRAFVDLAERTEGGGRWFERVPPESRVTSFPVEEIRRQLEAAGVDPDALNNADLEAVLRVFRPDAYKTRENEEWVIGPNGRPVHYIVEPNLHRALTGMNVGDVSWLDEALGQLPAPRLRELFAIFREGEVGKGLKGTLLNRKLWEALLFGPARLRRAGATLAPEFQGRNVLRDTFDRAMLSQVTAKGKVPVVWPFADMVRAIVGVPKGLLSAIQHDEWYEARLRGGGEIASLPSLDLYDIQRRIDDVLTGRDGADWHTVYHPVQLARLIGTTLEDVNRIAETRDVMEARGQRGTTASKSEMLVGGTASREGTVDFNMIGAMTKRLAINRLAAFFNANIEGNYRTYRAFRADPGRMAWFAFMTITLPSLLLWWAEHDDPRWAEIPQWQKDNSWIYLTGAVTEAQYAKMSKEQRRALMRQTVWRVPKPWLPGVVFGSVPERILDWAYGHTPRTLVESLTQTLGVAASMSLIPTPTMLEPILDNLVDYMSFFGRPVEGRGMKEKEAGYRVRPHTSRVARWIAGGFDAANEAARSTAGTKPVPEMLRSPLQVDHILQSLGGGLERLGAEVVNWTVDFFDKNAPPKPERTWADIPGIRAFAVRFPTTQSESIDKFYDIYTDAQQAVNTYRPMVGPKKPKAGAPPVPERLAEQAAGYEQRRGVLLLAAPALAKVAKTLGERRKNIQAIYDDKTKAPSIKRAEIEELVMDMIEAASDGVRQVRDVERAVAAGARGGP